MYKIYKNKKYNLTTTELKPWLLCNVAADAVVIALLFALPCSNLQYGKPDQTSRKNKQTNRQAKVHNSCALQNQKVLWSSKKLFVQFSQSLIQISLFA